MDHGFIDSSGGLRLYYRRWAATEPRGGVLLVHGFAEHGNRYEHVAAALTAAGFSVAAMDLRGHGQSEGDRGHVERFDDYLDDVRAGLDQFSPEIDGLPLFLAGHSMGGLVAARYAARDPEGLAGLTLSAPGLGLSIPVPAWKSGLAHVMSGLAPKLAIPSGIDAALISHDPAIVAAYENDPLVFQNARARWFIEFVAAQDAALASAGQMRLPLLMQVGTGDQLVSIEAIESFCARYGGPDNTLLRYEGFFHEIYNEIERARPIGDLVAWLQSHVGVPMSEEAAATTQVGA